MQFLCLRPVDSFFFLTGKKIHIQEGFSHLENLESNNGWVNLTLFLRKLLQNVSQGGGKKCPDCCHTTDACIGVTVSVQFSWNKTDEGISQEHSAYRTCMCMLLWWLGWKFFFWICLLWDWRWKQVALSFIKGTIGQIHLRCKCALAF